MKDIYISFALLYYRIKRWFERFEKEPSIPYVVPSFKRNTSIKKGGPIKFYITEKGITKEEEPKLGIVWLLS